MGRLTTAALALGMLLASCAPTAPPTATRTFVIAQPSEPRSLDPLLDSGYTSEELGTLVYSYLVRIDPRGVLEPDLAERVPSIDNGDISRDGKTIVYHLRRGIEWQDGPAFTAADVIATYRAVMDPRNPVPTRLGFDRIADIRALDPNTLRIRLRSAFAPFLTYFFETENYPVLPAHVLVRSGDLLKGSTFDSAPIGTGPYRVLTWQHGERLALQSFPRYFGGTPSIARLNIDFVPDAQTIVERLATGEADAYLAADPFTLAELRSVHRVRLDIAPIYGFLSFSMQTRDPALLDPAVRRAIVHAFDFSRDVPLASHSELDARDAGRGLFTWAYEQRSMPSSSQPLPSDLTLSIDSTRPLERTLAQLMQQEAHGLGSRLVIVTYSPLQFEATAADAGPLASGRFQLALHEVLTGADPETSWILACAQIPPTGYNVSRYCNSDVDRALADALASSDRTRRIEDYGIVQRLFARDAPFVPIAQLREIEAIPMGMSGFQPSLETPFYHAERWRV